MSFIPLYNVSRSFPGLNIWIGSLWSFGWATTLATKTPVPESITLGSKTLSEVVGFLYFETLHVVRARQLFIQNNSSGIWHTCVEDRQRFSRQIWKRHSWKVDIYFVTHQPVQTQNNFRYHLTCNIELMPRQQSRLNSNIKGCLTQNPQLQHQMVLKVSCYLLVTATHFC